MAERGRETSRALSEMRTVLNRAITAREEIATTPEAQPGAWVNDGPPRVNPISGFPYDPPRYAIKWEPSGPAQFDPDQAEMLAALDSFIAAAKRWTRTGRPLKGKS